MADEENSLPAASLVDFAEEACDSVDGFAPALTARERDVEPRSLSRCERGMPFISP